MAPDSIAFDRTAGFYDETRGFPPGEAPRAVALICQAGRLSTTSRVLEVGVGTGRIALPLAPHVGAVYGVDISRPMMERLRAKQSGEPVYLAQADATRLPFPSRIFDAVLMVHVLHLIPRWQDVLQEVARVLRPGGVLISGHAEHGHQALRDAWKTVVNPQSPPHARLLADTQAMAQIGWRAAGDELRHIYKYQQRPQEFVEHFQKRVWSSTWNLSDEELERGVAALRALIAEEFDDPGQPVELTANFIVRAYLPPRS